MIWVYRIAEHTMYRSLPTGGCETISSNCYSGQSEDINDPSKCCESSKGPLPPGTYTIQAAITHPRLGPIAMALTPDPSNKMYSRSGFFIHGDSLTHPGTASEGCIVMPAGIRSKINLSDSKTLQVWP